ncbi:MAG: hypothetical protein AAF734_04680, partial [Bacteroidota bacterium]
MPDVGTKVAFATINTSPTAIISNFTPASGRLCPNTDVNFDVTLSSGNFTTVEDIEVRIERGGGSFRLSGATFSPADPVGANVSTISVTASTTWVEGDEVFVRITNPSGCETDGNRQPVNAWLDAGNSLTFTPSAESSTNRSLDRTSYSFTTSTESSTATFNVGGLTAGSEYTIVEDPNLPSVPLTPVSGGYQFTIDRDGYYYFDLDLGGCTPPLNISVWVTDDEPSQFTGILNSTICTEENTPVNIGWVNDDTFGELLTMTADVTGVLGFDSAESTYFINRAYINNANT